MKIWFISAYDQPFGNSSRSHDFSKFLVDRGHEVTFFTNSFCHFTRVEKLHAWERLRQENISGINVVWLKTPAYSGNGFGRAINMLVNAFRIIFDSKTLNLPPPDIILGPSVPLLTGFAAYTLARRYDKPFVFEIRDVWPEALVLTGAIKRYGPTYCAFRLLEKILYKKSDKIISTLPFVEEHVQAVTGLGKDIEYIPNGVDIALFGPPCCWKKTKAVIRTVTYIGGFGVDHDIDVILRVAKKLQTLGVENFYFKLVGSGIKWEKSVEYVRDNKLTNVKILSPIKKADISKLQCESDVLIAAITNSDSYKFGLNLNKLCGYLASGRPIILAGNPPNSPVADSGAWRTVPAGDVDAFVEALLEIANMPIAELAKRGRVARSYAEHKLGMEVLGHQMELALKSLIKES